METLCYIFLSFFALCGICYLARDGYRVWQGHRLCGIHFAVVCRAADFGNKRERDCALLLLSSFLSRPEAKHLVREVVLTGIETASFGRDSGESLHDFCIENPGPGFYSLIGIKTPGLTCANELGHTAAESIARKLQALPNPYFDPHRPGIAGSDDEIICQCQNITRGQILEAIARGATTPDGVKHRVGTGMGVCQGSRCALSIQKLLEEYGHGTL